MDELNPDENTLETLNSFKEALKNIFEENNVDTITSYASQIV